MPSEMKTEHNWQTRPDPFAADWSELRQMLEINPGLEAKTLFGYLQGKYPGRYQDGQLRTLQRKIKSWRALEGPPREVYFPQKHYPGRLCASDFTSMKKVGVTINRRLFDHLIYHFVMTYSNWETGTICYSESFEALSEGFQNALWELGGVPWVHRTDRLSAAVHQECRPEKFTDRYQSLLRHYGLKGAAIRGGQAHENGDVEQSHYRFKKALSQQLLLRGSHDFNSLEEYELFLRKLFTQLNAGRVKRLNEDLAVLRRLPGKRLEACDRLTCTVGPSSTINVKHNVYSVPSRLKGERVTVRVYMNHLELWYGQRKVEKMPRLRGERKHKIQYQHIIDSLLRKPGAFENYRYREDLFPTSRFRMAYDALKAKSPGRGAKEYLRLLYLAATEGERRVDRAVMDLLEKDVPITVAAVRELLQDDRERRPVQDVFISSPDLRAYDQLLAATT